MIVNDKTCWQIFSPLLYRSEGRPSDLVPAVYEQAPCHVKIQNAILISIEKPKAYFLL